MNSPKRIVATAILWLGRACLAVKAKGPACRLFALAFLIDPTHGHTLLYSAWGLLHTEQNELAVRRYRQLLRLVPDFGDAHFNLGLALRRLERFSEALEEFEIALTYSPEKPAIHREIAAMLHALRHYAQSIPAWRAVVQRAPEDAEAWGFLGGAYFLEKQWEVAIAALEKALSLQADPFAASELAACLMELDRYKDAEAVLRRALVHDDASGLRVQLANALFEQDRPEDAERLLSQVLAKDPHDPGARCGMVALLANTGRMTEAQPLAERLVAEHPDDPDARAAFGWVALKAERSEEALATFDAALQLQPGFDHFLAGRATALYRLGRMDEARSIAQSMVERDPSYFERHREWKELARLIGAPR